jgi:predicted nucleotidyltransferase component of viral defense system
MDRQNPYSEQVELLVRILPIVAEAECFALKGGTAINLFYRDMPRLSVDVDLVYTPIKSRDESLSEISTALSSIGNTIAKRLPKAKVHYSRMGRTDFIIKLLVQSDRSVVKIELSPVLRGTVYPPDVRRIRPVAEDRFGFVEMSVVSFEDLFGGKIVAALDRQHPRDLFDVKLLLENEGISPRLKEAFLVYLLSHNRRFLEILNPSLLELRESYAADFSGMTAIPVELADLEQARMALIVEVNRTLTPGDKEFLIAFNEGDPDWDHLRVLHARDLPAVRWKLRNLDRMNADDRMAMVDDLKLFLNV